MTARPAQAGERGESGEIALLGALLSGTHESFEAYRDSADKAARHALKAQLADRALERERVMALLSGQLRLLGGEQAAAPGPAAEAGDGLFGALKAVVARGDEDAVLDTVRRAETALLGRFDAALADRRVSLDTLEVIEEGQRRIAAGYRALLAQVAHR